MGLKKQLQIEVLKSLKKGNAEVPSVLRMAIAAINAKEKEKRYKASKQKPEMSEEQLAQESELTDDEIIAVLMSEVKKRKDAIALYVKGERSELAEKEQKEIGILNRYLPSQFSEEELKNIVQEAVREVGAQGVKEMGKVMAALSPKIKGRADGAAVSNIVKALLQK